MTTFSPMAYDKSMKKTSILLFALFIFLAAVLPAAYISPSPYGINVHLARNTVLDQVRDAGIKWIRIDINWVDIESVPGQFNFTELDRVVNYAAQNALSIFATIAYTPGWANGNQGANYPADHTPHWQSFVSRVVNRYKNHIRYWGIWNEPNMPEFFALPKDAFVNRVFRPAGEAIRSADPSAFIVGPELAHLTSEGREWFFWLKFILEQGREFIDIISHHIYESRGVYYLYELLERGEGFIPSVVKVIEEAGHGGKQLWLTEVGWHTAQFSMQVQADRYLEMLQTMKNKSFPAKIFFYEIIDDSNPAFPPFGIIRSNLEYKPAYFVYKEFIAGNLPDGPGTETPNTRKCYAEDLGGGLALSGPDVLTSLRSLRSGLMSAGNSGAEAVDWYYRLSDDLGAASRADSRIYRLGRELLLEVAETAAVGLETILDKPLSGKQLFRADSLLALLADAPEFAAWKWLVRLVRDQLPGLASLKPRQLLENGLVGMILRGRLDQLRP